jgi:hypothetical protein
MLSIGDHNAKHNDGSMCSPDATLEWLFPHNTPAAADISAVNALP